MKEILKKKLRSRKGFTLAELLIVVAIIAVLAAIAFPVFSAQLAKAQAGADLANLKSAISAASTELLTNNNADAQKLTEVANAALGSPSPQYKGTQSAIGGAGSFVFVIVPATNGGVKTLNANACSFGGNTLTQLKDAAKSTS